jgi:hypothetical protein
MLITELSQLLFSERWISRLSCRLLYLFADVAEDGVVAAVQVDGGGGAAVDETGKAQIAAQALKAW